MSSLEQLVTEAEQSEDPKQRHAKFNEAYNRINENSDIGLHKRIYRGLAYHFFEVSSYKEAAQYNSKLLTLEEQHPAKDDDLNNTRLDLADSLAQAKEFGKAISQYKKLLLERERQEGQESCNVISIRHNLAHSLHRKFDYGWATTLDRKNVVILEKKARSGELKPQDKNDNTKQLFNSRYQLGVDLYYQQKFRESLRAVEQNITGSESGLKPLLIVDHSKALTKACERKLQSEESAITPSTQSGSIPTNIVPTAGKDAKRGETSQSKLGASETVDYTTTGQPITVPQRVKSPRNLPKAPYSPPQKPVSPSSSKGIVPILPNVLPSNDAPKGILAPPPSKLIPKDSVVPLPLKLTPKVNPVPSPLKLTLKVNPVPSPLKLTPKVNPVSFPPKLTPKANPVPLLPKHIPKVNPVPLPLKLTPKANLVPLPPKLVPKANLVPLPSKLTPKANPVPSPPKLTPKANLVPLPSKLVPKASPFPAQVPTSLPEDPAPKLGPSLDRGRSGSGNLTVPRPSQRASSEPKQSLPERTLADARTPLHKTKSNEGQVRPDLIPISRQIQGKAPELAGFFDVTHVPISEDALDVKQSDQWFDNFKTETLAVFVDKDRFVKLPRQAKNVKIAVLDTGFNTKDANFLKLTKSERDRLRLQSFVKREGSDDVLSKDEDEAGHGTFNALLLLQMVPHAEIHALRVGVHSPDPEAVAQAVTWAHTVEHVDVITMAFGYVKIHKQMETMDLVQKAIEAAAYAKIIVFAAAANHGGQQGIAFPASLWPVICIRSASGNGVRSAFNPADGIYEGFQFLVLGEHVNLPFLGQQDHQSRKTGTSIAVTIAAAIAGVVLYLIRLDNGVDQITIEQVRTYAKSSEGMSRIFKWMCAPITVGVEWVKPWQAIDLSSCKSSSEELETRVAARKEICEGLARYLKKQIP